MPPVLVAFSGGGFRAMTGSMAIARALAVAPGGSLWPQVTHLASGSGGSWFSSQLCFGERFYHNITRNDTSVYDLVKNWGAAYSLRLLAELANGTGTPRPLHGRCHLVDGALDSIASWAFDHTKLPSAQWEPFTATILRGNVDALGGSDAPRRYGVRSGLRTATLLQMLSLPPDTYLTEPDGTLRSVDLLVDGAPIEYAVPLGFAADASGHLEWSHHVHAHVNLSVAGDVDGGGAQAGARAPLPLPSDPTVATVTAGSSAAMGAIASFAMVDQITPRLLRWAVRDCLKDTGLESLAVPTDGAAAAAAFPTYRFLDGGYTDNSAVAMALARMQRDCADGHGSGPAPSGTALDCDAVPSLVIVDHDSRGSMEDFSSQRLFRPPAGTPTINHWSAPDPKLLAPRATVFNATFPDASQFAHYPGTAGGTPSQFWNGTVLTADNPWYGVRGGQRVRVALVNPLFSTPLTPAQTFRGIFTRDDAAAYARLFEQTYAHDADAQSAAVAPLLHAFLLGGQ